MERILIVDDDPSILKVLTIRLESKGFQVFPSPDPDTALKNAQAEDFDLALVDLKLQDQNGIGLMQQLHQVHPDMPVIILTGYGTIQTAVEAMQKGACNYLTKPFDDRELMVQIQNCLEKARLIKEVKNLRQLVRDRYGFESIIGKSEKMKKVLDQVAQAAETDSIVHIQGESGTGKELVAKTLHLASPRKEGPFVAVNCAAVPETLLESEFFGYEKGAFTGAVRSKKGLMAEADGGTFFLDEISEMPMSIQAKLLRVLEEKQFYPLGSGKTVKTDARFIVASNKDLEDMVRQGVFREDLFYRIHVIPVRLPPLRERKEDIALLARHFLDKLVKKTKKEIGGFTPSAIQKLLLHDWPGNVRELENAIEYAVAMAGGDLITEDLLLKSREPGRESLKSLKDAKEDFERNYLIQLMELTSGNVTEAAKLAGKYRADFYELLRKYQLDPAEFRKA